jgi:hypothetical protein
VFLLAYSEKNNIPPYNVLFGKIVYGRLVILQEPVAEPLLKSFGNILNTSKLPLTDLARFISALKGRVFSRHEDKINKGLIWKEKKT